MNYYQKNVNALEFYGVKYREIKNVNDYAILENEIKGLLECGNKVQFMIDVENRKNESIEYKDTNMTIYFSLVSSLVFGLVSIIMGMLMGENKEL